MQKAIIILFAIAAVNLRASEEPIELAAITPPASSIMMGRSGKVEATLAHGTNARFQWFFRQLIGGIYGTPSPIEGATNLTLQLNKIEDDKIGIYILTATNSISTATAEFSVWVGYPLAYDSDTYGGWEGLAGETFRLFTRLPVTPSQWFHDGKPLPEDWNGEGILSPDTEGTYWFNYKDDYSGEIFTSPRVMARIKPDREASEKFRAIYSTVDGDRATANWIPALREDGAITFIGGRKIWRWTAGALQKLFDISDTMPGFTNGSWGIWSATSDQGGYVDGLGREVFNGGFSSRTGVVRVDAQGTRFIGQAGLQVGPDPAAGANKFSQPKRAGRSTAFWAWTNGVSALKVYDGTTLNEWFNSATGFPPAYADWITVQNEDYGADLGFDGITAAFVASHPIWRRHGLFTVNATGEIKVIASRGDPIPGTPFTIQRIAETNIERHEGKILFIAYIFENFSNTCLIEYDPQRAEPFKVIAMEGDVVDNDVCVGRIFFHFHYLSDGSIVFNAMVGSFKADVDTPFMGGGYPSVGLFHYANGKLTQELNSRTRLGGTQLLFPFIQTASGTNYVFQGYGFFATTAPAGERPLNASVEVQPTPDGLRASWSGDGWLQASDDLLRWNTVFGSTGVITNDFAKNSRFLRVFYP